MRGKGTKLGEGIRDFYVWDFYHFWDSGFLHSGLFHLGKVCGAVLSVKYNNTSLNEKVLKIQLYTSRLVTIL